MISAQLTSINFRFFLSLVIVFFSFMCVCGESNYRFLQPLLEHSRSSSTGRSVSTIHKSILPSLSFLQQYPAPAPPYPQGFYASPFPQSTSQDTPSGNLYQSYVRERQAVSNQPFTDSSPSMSEVDGKGFRRLAIGAGALSGAFVGAYGAGGVGTGKSRLI